MSLSADVTIRSLSSDTSGLICSCVRYRNCFHVRTGKSSNSFRHEGNTCISVAASWGTQGRSWERINTLCTSIVQMCWCVYIQNSHQEMIVLLADKVHKQVSHNHLLTSSSGMANITATYVRMVVWNVTIYIVVFVRALCWPVITHSLMWTLLTSSSIHSSFDFWKYF